MSGTDTATKSDAKVALSNASHLPLTPPREKVPSSRHGESVGSNPPPYPTLSRSSSLSPPPINSDRRLASPEGKIEGTMDQRGRPLHQGDMSKGRQLSPFPGTSSRGSVGPSANGSLDTAAVSQFLRRPPSPRLLGSRSISGGSPNVSIDSQHSRMGLLEHGNEKDKGSISTDGQPFKRWGPASSPNMSQRLPKMYIPINLSNGDRHLNVVNTEQDSQSRPQITGQQSLKLPKIQAHLMDLDHYESRSVDSQNMSMSGAVNLKRKSTEIGDISRSNSPFAYSVPSINNAAGGVAIPLPQSQPSNAGHKEHTDNAAHTTMKRQEQEIQTQEESQEWEMANTSDRRGNIQFFPQRKSCDRCFKMKTKCSRAAPGAPADAPCDGCIRRGCGDLCHTSRPDFPFPRVTLSKRQRRESSMPDMQDPEPIQQNGTNHSSRQPVVDWRTKLITNDRSRGQHDSNGAHKQVNGHSFSYARNTLERSVSNQEERVARQLEPHRNSPMQGDRRLYHSSAGTAITAPNTVDNGSMSHQANSVRVPTSDMRARMIPNEVDTSASHHSLQGLAPTGHTPMVPSMPHPSLGPPAPPLPNAASVGVIDLRRSSAQAVNSLSHQAMQNIPMQLLPKAIGIPALGYFDQLIYPMLSLTVLSSKSLMEQLETYTKPGRNNIIEIVAAIGLHLQGALLACSDKGQASTVEGRIFKVFLQTSKNQNQAPADQSEGLTIETIKSWTESSRHRNRGKDIVKLVCMRRCLKYGLDYDDVLENVLLAHFYLIRGDVCNFHLYTGESQRQFDLLEIQGAVGPSERWTVQDIEALRTMVVSMDLLHPIGHWKGGAIKCSKMLETEITKPRHDFITLLARLSDGASLLLSHPNEKGIEDKVDEIIQKEASSATATNEKSTDDYWVSEMVTRGSNHSAPLLRLRSLLLTSYLRIVSRHHHLLSTLRMLSEAPKESQSGVAETRAVYWKKVASKEELVKGIQQVHKVAASTLSSLHLAFTIFPHLTSLTQAFAAELSAVFWSLLMSNLILQSFSIEERSSSTLSTAADGLTLILTNLESSREKESWPFLSSLRVVQRVWKDVKESEKAPSRWLAYFIRFRVENAKGFTRMIKGDPVNAAQLDQQKSSNSTSSSSKQQQAANTTTAATAIATTTAATTSA